MNGRKKKKYEPQTCKGQLWVYTGLSAPAKVTSTCKVPGCRVAWHLGLRKTTKRVADDVQPAGTPNYSGKNVDRRMAKDREVTETKPPARRNRTQKGFHPGSWAGVEDPDRVPPQKKQADAGAASHLSKCRRIEPLPTEGGSLVPTLRFELCFVTPQRFDVQKAKSTSSSFGHNPSLSGCTSTRLCS